MLQSSIMILLFDGSSDSLCFHFRADVSDNYRDALAAIDYNGTVHWYPHTIYRSSCSIDVTNFPYDHQACHMWFGSWTHTTNEIDIHMLFSGKSNCLVNLT